jgi:hypothetical protein
MLSLNLKSFITVLTPPITASFSLKKEPVCSNYFEIGALAMRFPEPYELNNTLTNTDCIA